MPATPNRPDDDVVAQLRAAQSSLASAYAEAARSGYAADAGYRDAFDEWTRRVGVDGDPMGFEAAGRRLALRAITNAVAGGDTATTSWFPGAGDDGCVPGWPDLAPVPPSTPRVTRHRRDLEAMNPDPSPAPVIAALYDDAVSTAARAADGQFTTPPGIAATLVRWALDSPGNGSVPRVLDPAAGTGIFAAAAHRHLAAAHPARSPVDLLDRVPAVDVNALPLRLCALTLAARAPDATPADANVHHASFFDLDPADVGPVDAVIGNPPYVEAGSLRPDREHYRAHLDAFGPPGAAPYREGADAIAKSADAYVYFVTHATRFLAAGGRLAMVLPTKWLTAKYGEAFRGFLREHYRVEAVIGFDARAFADALVETALVLLERRDEDADGGGGATTFLRLDGRPTPGAVIRALDADGDAPGSGHERRSTRVGRAVRVRADRVDAGRVRPEHYLNAPAGVLDLLDSSAFVPLGDLAAVSRGVMTGSTAFFFPERDTVESYGVADRFLRPAVKSIRDADTARINADTPRVYVDTHAYVDAVRDEGGEGSLEDRVTRALERDGFDGLLAWIRAAEADGEHRGATCEARDVWFDAGAPPRPAILVGKLLRERCFAMWNPGGAVPSNAVDGVAVHADVGAAAIFGVLNSSLVRAVMEAWGRNEAGMLQLMTYETRSLPVPDVRMMGDDAVARIVDAVSPVLEGDAAGVTGARRDRLDAAVLDAVDAVEYSVGEVQALRERLRDRRLASGEAGDVVADGAG